VIDLQIDELEAKVEELEESLSRANDNLAVTIDEFKTARAHLEASLAAERNKVTQLVSMVNAAADDFDDIGLHKTARGLRIALDRINKGAK